MSQIMVAGFDESVLRKISLEKKANDEAIQQKRKFDELTDSIPKRIPIEERQSQPKPTQNQEPDHSIQIEEIRNLVLGFNEMLMKVLKPDFPTMRSERKKYIEEINYFKTVGFREIIRGIKIKIDALCDFEGIYDKDMFNKKDRNGKIVSNWFDERASQAINQKNFGSAQEVISAVTQIIMPDEIVMHRRKFISKMK